ncbi:MAG: sugar O-acetyltransferase [Rubrivivax sp.]
MRSEKAKMLAGDLYDPADPELQAERRRARSLCRQLQSAEPGDQAALLQALLGNAAGLSVTPPFFCDYGYNLKLGSGVYFNVNCVLLDVCEISIGSHTLFGPGVHVYTALHPLDARQRRSGLEYGRPVRIGSDVWIGGSTVVCPGADIGDGTVVGAGSVVTRPLPAGVLAVGNPCRVVRSI